jgi:hypothetical protein
MKYNNCSCPLFKKEGGGGWRKTTSNRDQFPWLALKGPWERKG